MRVINDALAKNVDTLAKHAINVLKIYLADKDYDYTGLLSNMTKFVHRNFTEIYADIIMEDYGILIDKGYDNKDASRRALQFGITTYLEELEEWLIVKKKRPPEKAKKEKYAVLQNHFGDGYWSFRGPLFNGSTPGAKGWIELHLTVISRVAQDFIINEGFTEALVRQMRVNEPTLDIFLI